MATTAGSINTITVTRDEIIKDALQDIRALSDGANPTAGDLTDATRKLNFMLKLWATKGRLLWCLDTILIPCVASKTTYTIGPVGADVISYRPLRVFNGTFIRQVTAGQNYDTSLIVLSRLEYEQYGNKQALGVVNSVYYNPVMTGLNNPSLAYDPANAMGVLSVYVTPLDASRTIHLKTQRPIQEIVLATQTFDLPLEWYNALTKNLGAQMADKYEVPEQRITRIKKEAAEALEEITDWAATEEAPMFFTPDAQHYG
jgi:hypothetical protein